MKPVDTSVQEVSPESLSDEEISFKLSTEERERALQAQQWPSSPEEELHVVPQQVALLLCLFQSCAGNLPCSCGLSHSSAQQ